MENHTSSIENNVVEGWLKWSSKTSANIVRCFRGTHGVHMIYWEDQHAYGGGGGGFIVAISGLVQSAR